MSAQQHVCVEAIVSAVWKYFTLKEDKKEWKTAECDVRKTSADYYYDDFTPYVCSENLYKLHVFRLVIFLKFGKLIFESFICGPLHILYWRIIFTLVLWLISLLSLIWEQNTQFAL